MLSLRPYVTMWDVRKGYYQSLALEIEATNSNSQSLAPAMFSHIRERRKPLKSQKGNITEL